MGASAQGIEEWLTVTQVAAMLRKSRSFIHKGWPKWVKEGVKPVRVGGSPRVRLLFKRQDIDKLLESWRVA